MVRRWWRLPKKIRGWWVANDGSRWLVNVDSKGLTTSQTLKWADNGPMLAMSQISKGANNGPGLTKSQTSKGLIMGLG